MLYVCATPIGNFGDITYRAIKVLASADIVLCEDTRLSVNLLNHYNLKAKKVVAFHEHNENELCTKVKDWLDKGLNIIQLTDAGTPAISDPGARLCNFLLKNGYSISPLPGACAYVSLMSVAGIIDHAFLFFGFLPRVKAKRQKQLLKWQQVDYAIAIYEAPHRILATLNDISEVLGQEREIVMGRELTKQFETIKKCQAYELLNFIRSDKDQQRGEFTLIIMPNLKKEEISKELSDKQITLLKLLATELPPKKASSLCAKITRGDKQVMYDFLVDKMNLT